MVKTFSNTQVKGQPFEVTGAGEISARQDFDCSQKSFYSVCICDTPCEYTIVWEKFHIKNFLLVVWYDKN